MNILKVKFRWCDQPASNEWKDRCLWVETCNGDRALYTFQELVFLIGEVERKRIVKYAIRNGSGTWHYVDGRRRKLHSDKPVVNHWVRYNRKRKVARV